MRQYVVGTWSVLLMCVFVVGCLGVPQEQNASQEQNGGRTGEVVVELSRVSAQERQLDGWQMYARQNDVFDRATLLEIDCEGETPEYLLLAKNDEGNFSGRYRFEEGEYTCEAVAYENCTDEVSEECVALLETRFPSYLSVVATRSTTLTLQMVEIEDGGVDVAVQVWVSVLDFDSPQQAVNECIPGVEGIFFPPGVYNFTATLQLKSGCPITGSGFGLTVFTGGVRPLIRIAARQAYDTVAYWNTSITYIQIDHSGAYATIEVGDYNRVEAKELVLVHNQFGFQFTGAHIELFAWKNTFVPKIPDSKGLYFLSDPMDPIIQYNHFHTERFAIFVEGGADGQYPRVVGNNFFQVANSHIFGIENTQLDPQFVGGENRQYKWIIQNQALTAGAHASEL